MADVSEDRELLLVDKLELRLALAKDAAKFESLLKKYLCPLLLKLKSPHIKVRNKTVSICMHLGTRIEGEGIRIQLPALALLQQLRLHGDSKLMRLMNSKFLRIAISRTNDQAELETLIKDGILKDISKFLPSKLGAYLFYFLLHTLFKYELPRRGTPRHQELRSVLGITGDDGDRLALSLGKLLLLPSSKETHQVEPVPGLTAADREFYLIPEIQDAWDPDKPFGLSLNKAKAKALDFGETAAFTSEEQLWIFLFAIQETNTSAVSDRGTSHFRALKPADPEDPKMITRLLELYCGGNPPGHPPPISLQTRILGLLSKSKVTIGKLSGLMNNLFNTGLVDEAGGLMAKRFNAEYVSFMVHYLRMKHDDTLSKDVASLFIARILRFLTDNQGWPIANPGANLKLRGSLYQLIGIVQKEARLHNLETLMFLIASLNTDNTRNDTLLSIEEAISSVTVAFAASPLDRELQLDLESILLTTMDTHDPDKLHRSCFYVISRLANRCLPYSSSAARALDVRICGSKTGTFEAAEEARKGLDPNWFKNTNLYRPDLWKKDGAESTGTQDGYDFEFPGFCKTMDILLPAHDAVDSEPPNRSPGEITEQVIWLLTRSFEKLSKENPEVFAISIQYTFRLLMVEGLEASELPRIDEQWERAVSGILSSRPETRTTLKRYLTARQAEGSESPISVISLVLAGLRTFSMTTTPAIVDCRELCSQLLSAVPAQTIALAVKRGVSYRDILKSLESGDRVSRNAAARSFGILSSNTWLSEPSTKQVVDLMSSQLVGSDRSKQGISKTCGAILGLAHSICRVAKTDPVALSVFPVEDLHKAVASIVVDSKDEALLDVAYLSLGYFGIWSIYGTAMRFPIAAAASDGSEIGPETIVRELSVKSKAGNERAILALGQFSTWLDEENDQSLLLQVYETLRACYEVRRIETQLPVGESLSCVAFGARSSALKHEFDDENSTPNRKARSTVADHILEETIKGCFQPKPTVRRASVIWLQSLVEFSDHHAAVKGRLRECQRAFRSNLGNREVLVQEAAANGLCLVYGMADRDLKDELVRDLIASFSENKSSLAGTVSEDTQLFDEGDLPTKDGSVSTYGDILNLASEVGDPSLVYRFMSMASNSAIWSSRAAFGKFGLSQILSDSSADGYLAQNPKLFPALYRYMFDPNPNVQRSMRSLWQSLVKDQTSVLDQHFDLIIEDLLKNIVGPEWRSREASCRAIGDLVQDRDVRLYEQHLDEIWKSCSKVMDDIKGSVRLAAMQLAKTLSGILVRKIESPDASDEASKMLTHVIPFLLSGSGVESGVKESQGWAVSTLLQIIKKGRRSLMAPYATAILESFIPLFSSMEPDFVNYLHLNAGGYNLTTQEIDESRLKFSVRHNPLMEGAEKLIDTSYGSDVDRQIASVVEAATKSSLGMPSQTATSRILVTMFVRNHLRFKDFADPLLVAIQKPMLDRNETVGNSYAYAAGYLSRHASDDMILKTTGFAWKLSCNSDEPRHRSVAAEVFYSISKHATDRFSHLSGQLLPLVFLGKHDDQDDVKETFSNTWGEVAGGQRAVLLHLDSICQLAVPMLDDPKWVLKHASARAIADAAEAVASLDALAAVAEAPKVWPALSKALGGRSWDGKEVVLEAFGTFFEKVQLLLEQVPDVGKEMTKIVLREAKRQNRAYQKVSLKVLGRYAAIRKDLDLSEDVLTISSSTVAGLVSTADEMDVDGPEAKIKDSLRDDIIISAASAASHVFSPAAVCSKGFPKTFARFVEIMSSANSIQDKLVAEAVFEALGDAFHSMSKSMPASTIPDEAELVQQLQSLLFQPRYLAGGETLRTKRARAISRLAKLSGSLARSVLETELAGQIASEPIESVRAILQEAQSLIE